ncbi:MAG TPA: tetratricopeptide repeat protein [Bryobacteraceae bacterium]|jgi:hypothetical protein
MCRRYRCPFLSLLLLIAVHPAIGQKKLQVKMPHPPILGESLAGARVIFGQVTGRCSKNFSELLRQDLLAHDIPLVAQAEPGVTAVVTISVDISECQALPEPAIIGTGLPAMHISRTVGHFLATLHVKDWWSGEELATQTLRADPSKQNESPSTQPEWPAPADLITTAQLQALGQTRRLYEPWIDTEEVSFMDDKDCNLRAEFDLFKAADYKGLLQAALANTASCHGNPKTVAAAWYNLGIAYMVMQNYDGALAAFAKTGKLRDSRPVTDAMAQCQANKSLAQALGRHILAWEKQTQKDTQPAKPVRTGIIFSNDLVIRLVQGNVDDADILKMIDSEPNRFALGDDDLLNLKQAGVPDAIVAEMQKNK